MKTDSVKLNSWVMSLSNTKPYRVSMKNGKGFFEIIFLYGDYHYSDKLYVKELEDELNCQKKILNMCSVFENNIKLKVF
jgi:hypothetical protein